MPSCKKDIGHCRGGIQVEAKADEDDPRSCHLNSRSDEFDWTGEACEKLASSSGPFGRCANCALKKPLRSHRICMRMPKPGVACASDERECFRGPRVACALSPQSTSFHSWRIEGISASRSRLAGFCWSFWQLTSNDPSRERPD